MTPHLYAGQPVRLCGIELPEPTPGDFAEIGAFVKWVVNRECLMYGAECPAAFAMNHIDNDCVNRLLHSGEWVGIMQEDYKDNFVTLAVKRRTLSPLEIQRFVSNPEDFQIVPTILEDAVNLEAIRKTFLFPYVNCVAPARGRRVRGGMMVDPDTNPQRQAQKDAENAKDTLAGRDTVIVAACAGLELDKFTSPDLFALGRTFVGEYSDKLAEWLDRVIATGDGITEPLGIFSTRGICEVLSRNNAAGPPVPEDYEALMFGVPKEFRREIGGAWFFVGNERSYRRSRAMNVGGPDQRRLFGPGEWEMLGRPYLIADAASNRQAAFVNLKRYRMYARPGTDLRLEFSRLIQSGETLTTEDKEPAKLKPFLLVARKRFGGGLEVEGAAAVCNDGQE